MAIIRWNPWSLDRFFTDDWDFPTTGGITNLTSQGLNLYETEDSVIAEIALPGIPEENIDVSVDDNGIVRISASHEDTQEDRRDRRYFLSSMAKSFSYAFRLPQDVTSTEEPACEFQDGVLRLIFPKQQKKAPKKITISTKSKSSKNSDTKAAKSK